MKFLKKCLSFIAVLAVFSVSFAAGRMTAVRSSLENAEKIKEETRRAVAILPLLRASEEAEGTNKTKEASEDRAAAVSNIGGEEKAVLPAAPEEETDSPEENSEEPPFPLLLPAKGTVLQDYSLQTVYSETMKDWRSHTGIDIEGALADPVTAAADGEVTRAYEDKLWGGVIEITHRGGLKTVYKGVSTLSMISVGKKVSGGETISGIGSAPAESKAMPHIHFETWLDGVCINPKSCMAI